MRFILLAVIFLCGLLNLFMGLSFLIQPTGMVETFGLIPQGSVGLAVMRADFFSFFTVAAFCLVWGAWRRNGDLLLVPALLFGLAFTGRLVSVFVDGTVPGFWVGMSYEAFHVALALFARAMLPHHTIHEIVD
jgi:hypothetical protein